MAKPPQLSDLQIGNLEIRGDTLNGRLLAQYGPQGKSKPYLQEW